MPVFRGYPEELVCEADGHPHPEIKWVYSSDKVARVSDNMLTVSEAGLYNCTATNAVGSDHYVVEVILKGTNLFYHPVWVLVKLHMKWLILPVHIKF